MTIERPVALGIIGCGDVAFRTYLPALLPLTDRMAVVATYDPVLERAQRAAALFSGARAYDGLDGLLAHPGLTAVIDLAPAPHHSAINRSALDAGLHVLTEKPIASSVEDGRELAALAEERGLLLLSAPAVMATERFRWLAGLIAAGRIGSLTALCGQMANMGPAAWRGYTGDPAVFYSEEVGPLVDTGVYVLHAMIGLAGPVRSVVAQGAITIPQRSVRIPSRLGSTVTVSTPDVLSLSLHFACGAIGQLLSSFAVPRSRAPIVEVHGSLGSISIAADGWYDADGPVDIFLQGDDPADPSGWMPGVAPPDPSPAGAEHLIAAGPRHFIDCLTGVTEPVLTADHAIHVLEIIEATRTTIATGQRVELSTSW